MDKDNLPQEELLEVLNWAFSDYVSDNNIVLEKFKNQARQAYPQLKEIVEWAYARGIPQQKKTVTRETLHEHASHLVDRIDAECGLLKLQRIGILHLLTEKGDLEDIYFDVGVEVVE